MTYIHLFLDRFRRIFARGSQGLLSRNHRPFPTLAVRSTFVVSPTSSLFLTCLVSLALTVSSKGDGPEGINAIADALRRQDHAWDDLTVSYKAELWTPSSGGSYQYAHTTRFRWVITSQRWEKITRITPGGPGRAEGESDWEETVAFNGELYMGRDSQNQGSGTIGRKVNNLLNDAISPKTFGLVVTGQEISQPISPANFLTMKKANAKVVRTERTQVIVRGDDPVAEGYTLNLWLDPAMGYRPVQIESRDRKGLHSLIGELTYRCVKGARGDFWFPVSGILHGVKSATREFGNQVHYHLENLETDRHPSRDEFLLTYPKGALILNTDTGKSGYLTAATTKDDLPEFKGKLMSVAEHDQQKERERIAPGGKLEQTTTSTRHLQFPDFWNCLCERVLATSP